MYPKLTNTEGLEILAIILFMYVVLAVSYEFNER